MIRRKRGGMRKGKRKLCEVGFEEEEEEEEEEGEEEVR